MNARPDPQDVGPGVVVEPGRLSRYAMYVLWPSFLMAGVTLALVFSLVDPADLTWFGAEMQLSRKTVYSLSFFALWLLFSVSNAITALLVVAPESSAPPHPRMWPR